MSFGNRDRIGWSQMRSGVDILNESIGEIEASKIVNSEIAANDGVDANAISEALQESRRLMLFNGLTPFQQELWDKLYQLSQLGGVGFIKLKYRLSQTVDVIGNQPILMEDVMDLFYVAHQMKAYQSGRKYEQFFNDLFHFLQLEKNEYMDELVMERFSEEPQVIETFLLKLVGSFTLIKSRIKQLIKLEPNLVNQHLLAQSISILLEMEVLKNKDSKKKISLIDDGEIHQYAEALMRDNKIFRVDFVELIGRLQDPNILNALMHKLVDYLNSDPKLVREYQRQADFGTIGVYMAKGMSKIGLRDLIRSDLAPLFCERLTALARLEMPAGVSDLALLDLLGDRPNLKGDAPIELVIRERQIARLQQQVKNKAAFQPRLMKLGLIKLFATDLLVNFEQKKEAEDSPELLN